MTDYSNAKEVPIKIPEPKPIVTFPTNGHRPEITWEYPEFQCLCPVSERHDQGTIRIRYLPIDHILESKSVREYLSSWRNVKVWQEYVTEEIAELLFVSCKPKWLSVEITWSSRGGIIARTFSKRGEKNGE
jgi:7-cyano-7-deazaguanine reductase